MSEDVRIIADIPYCSDNLQQRQNLDLYIGCESKRNDILLVYIHGGAWTERDKSMYTHIGRYFAQQGFFVAVTNYRLSVPLDTPAPPDNVKHPHHTLDCAAALVWLYSNASQYGYNKDKIFVIGHSAGAFMATLILLDDTFIKSIDCNYEPEQIIRGVIGLEGIYHINQMLVDFPSYLDWVVRPAFDGTHEDFEKISPAVIAKSKRLRRYALLIVHSKFDELLRVSQSELFYEAISTAAKQTDGKHCIKYLLLDDARITHNSIVDKLEDGIQVIAPHIISFVNEVLG